MERVTEEICFLIEKPVALIGNGFRHFTPSVLIPHAYLVGKATIMCVKNLMQHIDRTAIATESDQGRATDQVRILTM